MLFAEVCIHDGGRALAHPLTYQVPETLNGTVAIGALVRVPLRRKETTGFVVGLTDTSDVEKVKSVLEVITPLPLFSEPEMQLARWMASYYHAPLSDALACIIPPGTSQKVKRVLVWQGPGFAEALINHDLSPLAEAIVRTFQEHGRELSSERLRSLVALHSAFPPSPARGRGAEGEEHKLDSALKSLQKREWIREEFDLRPPVAKPRRVRVVELSSSRPGIEPRTARQRVLLNFVTQLNQPTPIAELLRRTRTSRPTLNALAQAGWVRFTEREERRLPVAPQQPATDGPVLNIEQQNALQQIESEIEAGGARTVLLHGVTASGKTEVYLKAIEAVLTQDRTAIMLVPEIALTAQTMEIFLSRFPGQVAILHSALSAGERYEEWMRLKRGEAHVALGPRSAVFAPLKNLGLIIVDEEHESSYKQESAPRYHAREVAFHRAKTDGAVVVLASATPSLESVFHARRGAYSLIELKERVLARPMPTVEIVDLRDEVRENARNRAEPIALGKRLQLALKENVERGEQVMLFLNRRGFSSVIFCPSCGVYDRCPNCAVSLTYHQSINRLLCHHCNFLRPPKEECPRCKGPMVGYGGPGTERVEREVRELLPGIETIRMDRDTTSRKGMHSKLLRAFRLKRATVLVGTQMIAKGLDFPGVTLVGVINADIGLHTPDWRAAERTFQLLVQVSGRAGRGESPGHVIVQTYLPNHYAITQAVKGDFGKFIEEELRFRQQLSYPPFVFTANVIVNARLNKTARERIERVSSALHEAARKAGAENALLGPAPCPIAKLRGEFRWHLFVRDHSRPRMHQILDEGIAALKPSDLRGLTIDVDPMTVM